MKQNLLSIGKLSELTGVHIQSLRYYEKLGILIPSYINPDSKYRYYSFPQIKIVEAIQYCVELEIPLKEVSTFIKETDGEIDYAYLIEYGQKISQQRIEMLKRKMSYFNDLHDEFIHGENCRRDSCIIANLPSFNCLVTPFNGTQASNEYYAIIMSLLAKVHEYNLRTNYDSGMLSKYTENGIEHYAYINIGTSKSKAELNVLHIPSGNYLCRYITESNIHNAPLIFEEQFQKSDKQIIIERELFTGNYEYKSPKYEIRCLLTDY